MKASKFTEAQKTYPSTDIAGLSGPALPLICNPYRRGRMSLPRPHIICHMVTSLDGRLLADRWPVNLGALLATYESVAARLEAEGWIVGREASWWRSSRHRAARRR